KLERWIGVTSDEIKEGGDESKLTYNPTNLAVDPDGLLYVVDTYLNHITVFDTDGEYVRTIGSIGDGPGQFMRPRGIALDSDGHIYVTDAMFQKFQILTAEGQPLLPVGQYGAQPGQLSVPAGIAVDKYNRIIVADQGNRRIQVFHYVPDSEAAADKAKTGAAKESKGANADSAALASGKKKK
ncbi:MAG: 6-bladed beta-propeller, partial [Acidobacteriaceae bacterium]|nr:6-bladed beta-propeller [Acidobacteriaceae bacterium]